MRTTIAAALVIALAACGGDGGPSLTEPNQIDLGACTHAAAAAIAGRWIVGEWGCLGRTSPSGFVECDPELMPWVDGEPITLVRAGIETFTLTIGGEMALAQPSGEASVSAELTDGQINISTCADGSALVMYSTAAVVGQFDTSFAAYAHRR